MKNMKLALLLTSALTLNLATAASLAPSEIFSAIDGESYGLHEQIQPQRVNFSISSSDVEQTSQSSEDILTAIDGESYPNNDWGSSTRTNYALSANDMTTSPAINIDKLLPRTYD